MIRKEKDWSQKDLARATGLNWTMINRYENGRALPNGENLMKLSKALGVTADYLLFEDVPRTRRISIKDPDLYEKFLVIEKMPAEDREAVRRLLEGLIIRNKLEDLLPENKTAENNARKRKKRKSHGHEKTPNHETGRSQRNVKRALSRRPPVVTDTQP